ncbi:deoxyribose-phosphate aldolase [uncultured Parolsenella sp.]|uniref:deoxyribose-phosphate aldolase n=1 Tax=uncultured Parolsenella sp. TaxID=2083008 RepID=UPI0025CC94C9|nr:deoxyribose-phosphate aldolase [uncultured Parolsenella sp.]
MELNRMIDHTLLKANATRAQIEKLCDEALEYNFASVCVNTCWVPLAHEKLAGSDVKTCCVVGFPLGAMMTEAKAAETRLAVEAGADEVDMVINVGWLLDGEYDAVRDDIAAVVKAADGKCVKVIIEACLLTDEQKVKACELSVDAGATFVKTSTGFSTGGATVADVALMRKTVGDRCLVKAAGGIHTADEARAMVEAGADRLGCSAGIQIMAGC